MPWLTRIDQPWLAETLAPHPRVYVLEDHAPVGGLGDHLLSAMMEMGLSGRHTLRKLAVEGYPACGTPRQALCFHRLDGSSVAGRILKDARVSDVMK